MANADHITLELTQDDLLAINNALNEVCHGANAIPEWEFQTLMGVERSEAQATLKKISARLPRTGT
jgi:hypothetical protein